MVFYGSSGERSRLRCHQSSYATGLFETLWGRKSHQYSGDKLTTNGVPSPFVVSLSVVSLSKDIRVIFGAISQPG